MDAIRVAQLAEASATVKSVTDRRLVFDSLGLGEHGAALERASISWAVFTPEVADLLAECDGNAAWLAEQLESHVEINMAACRAELRRTGDHRILRELMEFQPIARALLAAAVVLSDV